MSKKPYQNNIDTLPSVAIVIPVLNEENHIERVLQGFLETDYPNLQAIYVADGRSTDRTREIVENFSKNDSRVQLVDNQEKFQSYGLNKVIDIAETDVLLRADGHCIYAPDFVEKSVEALLKSEAKNVGGTQRYIAKNYTQAGIAIASKSFLGNGGAKYMNENFEGFSDTVFLGCFWLDDLKKLGGFSEANHTNEDGEINHRIIHDLNGKVYISPEIKIWYYPRANFRKLFKQYFAYGRGRCITSLKHDGKIPFRSKAPFLFVSVLLLLLIADNFLFDGAMGSFYILTALFFLLMFESVRVSIENKSKLQEEIWTSEGKQAPGVVITSVYALTSFLVMHLAHFCGFGYQKLKLLFTDKIRW